MSPIISRWKLVKDLYCLVDNRRTKDTQKKIKLRGRKACCMTLFSYSISHNFHPLKLGMESLK